MRSQSTLFLNRSAIASLLRPDDYIEAVERAFAAHGHGLSLATGLLHIDSHGGEFHVKSSGLELDRTYVGVKVNGAFWQNRERGLPYVHGGRREVPGAGQLPRRHCLRNGNPGAGAAPLPVARAPDRAGVRVRSERARRGAVR